MVGPNEEKTQVSDVVPQQDLPKEASLVQIYGPSLGQRYVIDSQEMVMGRDSRSEIVIDSDTVSRSHARVYVEGNRVYVQDLESTNGTRVNDLEVSACVLQNGDHLKIGSVIFKFITGGNAESLYHEEIYRMAIVDGLTGVPNRRYFEEFLERELARAVRYKRPLALAVIDADHFKQVNDNFGHLAGDYVLRLMARVARETTRREELFARYGGEEFVLVMPEKSAEHAHQYTEKLRGLIEGTHFEFDGETIAVTVSIGLANLTPEIRSVSEFVQAADSALYEAKSRGRNRVFVCGSK